MVKKRDRNKPIPIPERAPQNLTIQGATFRAERFVGPIPPPDLLEKYNSIIPNGAERIMAMAERQATHRQYIERKTIDGDHGRSWAGLIVGGIISFLVINGGLLLIYFDKPIGGLAAILGTLSTLVTAFIYGHMAREKERRDKMDKLQNKS